MEICEYIASHFAEMLDALDQIIQIPSVRGNGEPDAPFGREPLRALQKVLEIADNLGFSVRNCANRVGVIDLKPDQMPALGILCHADVVPAGGNWVHEPFRATLDGDHIYGRGAIDDKGPLVCALYAMNYLKDSGIPLKNNVRLLVGTDEECGSSDIAYYMAHETLPKAVFTPDANYPVIHIEKGRAVGTFGARVSACGAGKAVLSASGGGAVNAVPEKAYATVQGCTEAELQRAATQTACSSVDYHFTGNPDGTIQICAQGVSAHASLPEKGSNAVTGLIQLLAGLELPSCGLWKDAANLFPHGDTCGKAAGIACSDERSGALTSSLDVLSYQDGRFTATFDIRYPVTCRAETLRQALKESAAAHGFQIEQFEASPPHDTDERSPLVRTLLGVYEAATGKKAEPIATGGGTYVHGIPGGVAFGPELPGADNHMHAADEFISVGNFKFNIKLIAQAIAELDQILS